MTRTRTHRRISKRSIPNLALCAAALASLVLAGNASAQSIDIPAVMNPDLKAPPTAVAVQYGHQFETDIDAPGSDFSRNNVLFSVAHRIKLNEKTSFFAIGTYTLQAYDFSTNALNPYQWDDVHRGVLGGLFGYDVNEKWRLIGGGIVRSWGESGADFGDSISGGLIFGFDYHPDDDFSIGMLVGAFSALEDKMSILPVPTLKWKFAENWRWNVGMVSVFDPGVGTELSWQVSDKVSLGTGFTFQNRRYRLADKTRFTGNFNRTDDGGIGQESEIPVFLSVGIRPTPKSSIDLLGGVALAGNVRVESSAGGRIKDDNYEAAPFVGLKGSISF